MESQRDDDILLLTDSSHKPVREARQRQPDAKIHFPRLSTRSSPKVLVESIAKLNDHQKRAVQKMGFGNLLLLKIKEIPTNLSFWVLDNFDAISSVLRCSEGKIHIESVDVEKVLGFPKGDKTIELKRKSESCELLDKWRSKFTQSADKITAENVSKEMLECHDGGEMFCCHFAALVDALIIGSISAGYVNPLFFKSINDITNVSDLNWCEYTLQSLISKRMKWEKTNKTAFNGPLLFLVVLYVDRLAFVNREVPRSLPSFIGWNCDLLRKRSNAEAKIGGFGRGYVDKRLEPLLSIKSKQKEVSDDCVQGYKSKLLSKVMCLATDVVDVINLLEDAPHEVTDDLNYKKIQQATENLISVSPDVPQSSQKTGSFEDSEETAAFWNDPETIAAIEKIEHAIGKRAAYKKKSQGDDVPSFSLGLGLSSQSQESDRCWEDILNVSRQFATDHVVEPEIIKNQPFSIFMAEKQKQKKERQALEKEKVKVTEKQKEKDIERDEELVSEDVVAFLNQTDEELKERKDKDREEKEREVREREENERKQKEAKEKERKERQEREKRKREEKEREEREEKERQKKRREENEREKKEREEEQEKKRKEEEQEKKRKEEEEREQKQREEKERQQKEREMKEREEKERVEREEKERQKKRMEENERQKKEREEEQEKKRKEEEQEKKRKEEKERDQKLREEKEKQQKERELREREEKDRQEREKKEREDKMRVLKEREKEEKERKQKEKEEEKAKRKEKDVAKQMNISKAGARDEEIYNWILHEDEETMYEIIFQNDDLILMKEDLKSLGPDQYISVSVLDTWSRILNLREQSRKPGQPLRFFASTYSSNYSVPIAEQKWDLKSKASLFIESLNNDFTNSKTHSKFEDVDMIFFPVCKSDHLYVVCFDLKAYHIHILDNSSAGGLTCGKYEFQHINLKKLLVEYLKSQGMLECGSLVSKLKPVRLDLPWRDDKNKVDCGVFVMRHMETYFGAGIKNWNSGLLKDNPEQLKQMRIKYCSEIVLNEFNELKSENDKKADVFGGKKKPAKRVKNVHFKDN